MTTYINHIKSGVKNNDNSILNQLYNDIYVDIDKIVGKYIKDKDTKSDLKQDVFLHVINKIDKCKGVTTNDLLYWVRVVVKNYIIDYLRVKNRITFIEINDNFNLQYDQFCDLKKEYDISYDEIMLIINQLPNKCGEVIKLFYFNELTHQNISKILNISEGTSKSNLHRGKRLMLKIINKNKVKYEI